MWEVSLPFPLLLLKHFLARSSSCPSLPARLAVPRGQLCGLAGPSWPWTCPQPLKIPLEEQQFCSGDELSRKARGSGDIPAFSCQWFQGMLPVSPCLRHFMGNGARKDKKKQPRDHVFLILFWLFLSPLRSRSEVPLCDTALSAVPLPWHCIFQTKPNQTKPVMHQKAKPVFLI